MITEKSGQFSWTEWTIIQKSEEYRNKRRSWGVSEVKLGLNLLRHKRMSYKLSFY